MKDKIITKVSNEERNPCLRQLAVMQSFVLRCLSAETKLSIYIKKRINRLVFDLHLNNNMNFSLKLMQG